MKMIKKPKSWPTKIKKEIYNYLLDEIDCGPMDGGCLLMAKAIEALLKGEIFVIVNNKNKAEHAVFLLKDGTFLDADGIHHSSENLLNWFSTQEDIKEPLFLRTYEKSDLTQANQRVTPERIEHLSQIIKKWKNIFLEQKTNNTLKRLKN